MAPNAMSVRWPWIVLVLVGFPVAYLLNSLSPWARKFSLENDPAFFLPFLASLLTLHWLSAGVSVHVLRRSGLRLEDVGLTSSARTFALLAACGVGVGVAIIIARDALGPSEPLWPGPAAGLHLTSTGQRAGWIAASLSAGFCEELVYRGFGITVLRAHGLRAGLAVVLPTVSWVLVHGVGGVLLFLPHFLVGLLFAGLFLWRRRLAPVMFVHALVDLSLLGT
jgi:membrane protease YdiL (CAAX protease family)